MDYYIGFLKNDLNKMMLFSSIKEPTKYVYWYFGKIIGPYRDESEARATMYVLKRTYGYQENPAKSEHQRKFMCADLGRLRSGRKTVTGMRKPQLRDYCRKKNPAGSYTVAEVLKYFKKDVLPKIIDKYGTTNTNMIKLAFKEYLGYLITFKVISPRILKRLETLELDTVKGKEISASQIKRGTEHELEHTTDRAVARKIACDHLREDPYYYTHLAKMEKEYKKNPGKEYHDKKFMRYMRELEKYKVGSEPYIATLAKAYEHLESANDSEHESVR